MSWLDTNPNKDPASSHVIQIDSPQIIAGSIEEVLAAASKGVHLVS